MKISLSLFLTLVAVGSISSSAFCDDQPGNQKTAKLDTQVKVQMGYRFLKIDGYASAITDFLLGTSQPSNGQKWILEPTSFLILPPICLHITMLLIEDGAVIGA